jgi:hypothetical protein
MDQSTRDEKTYLSIQEKKPDPEKDLADTNLMSLELECLKDNFLTDKSLMLVLLFFIIYSIGMMVLVGIHSGKVKLELKLYGWILLSIAAFVMCLSFMTYFLRNWLVNKETSATFIYTLFIIYVCSIEAIITVLGLYNIKVALVINTEITGGLFVIYVLNKLFCLEKKFWINLMIVYMFIFIGIILYIIFFNYMFVEFFIITIFCSLSFAYLSSLSKNYYEEFYTNFIFGVDDYSLRIHMTVLVSSHIDMMICTFKD